MLSSIYKIALLFTMLAPVTQALWVLQTQFTWSDRRFDGIIVREQNQTDPVGVRRLKLGETVTIGPLDRKDYYMIEMFHNTLSGTILLEFSKEWNISLSPNITKMRGVEIRHRNVCADNWYGDDCDTYCETSVSHRCTIWGEKICFPGYEGADCARVTTTSPTTTTNSSSTVIPTTKMSLEPTVSTVHEDNKVEIEVAAENTDFIQVNRTVYGFLVATMILLGLVLVAICAVAFLRRKPYATDPLLPTHQQDICATEWITPPRLKLLSEMLAAKSEEMRGKAPTILTDCNNIMDANINNKEVVHVRERPAFNQYSSPPSLRDSESGSIDRNTIAFSVVTLPEPMKPLETNHYASITSHDTPKSSRTVKEMIV